MHTLFHISILKFIKLQGVLPIYPFSLYVINAHTVSYLYRVVYQSTMSVAQISVQFVSHQRTQCFISLSWNLSSNTECCSAIRSVCTSSMHTLFHISILKFINLQRVLLNYPFSLYVINAHTVSYLYFEIYQAARSVAQLSVQFVRYKCTHCFISLSWSLSSYNECCSAIRSVCTSSMHTLFHISIL